MRGTLFLVVGPSGAGKDTLIAAAARARPDLFVPRRVVTRSDTAGGEEIDSVDPREFEDMERAGAFALSWRAHGLAYGIPAELEGALSAGRDALVNVSRGVVDAARARFAPVRVIAITAEPGVLADRLAARGREDAGEIEARLVRSGLALPEGPDVTLIRNDAGLAAAEAALIAATQPRRG